MLQDIRYALRSYLRNPGFSLVALVTLALGIGGATTIFSVVDGILLRPLPYAEPDRIVRLGRVSARGEDGAFSPADFLDLKRDTTTLIAVSGFREDIVDLTGRGDPVRVRGVQTSPAFFDAFGVRPLIGRTYTESSDKPGAALAVIAESLWHEQFGSAPSVIGSTVRVNGQPTTIVGVVARSFRHPLPGEIWTLSPLAVPVSPVPISDTLGEREVQYFGAVARLAPGRTLGDARTEAIALAGRAAKAFPDTNAGESFSIRPLGESLVADVRTGLLVLLGAVACVLLIACANVAGLMMAKGSARRRELAVRSSLGAGAGRLARQLLTESVALALVGGGVGVLLAAWSLDLLLAIAPDTIPRLGDVSLDWRVAAAAFTATTIVGMLAGTAPALQSARPQLTEDLRDGGRTTTAGRTRLRAGLVVAEVALALVLLIGAGLLLSSLMRLQAVDPGFRTTSLVAIELPLPQARYDEHAQRRFYTSVLDKVQANPVSAESAILFPFPLKGSTAGASFEIDGLPTPREQQRRADLSAVSPDYFRTMGIRLVKGRTFTAQDGPDAPPVAIVSERLAAEWGNRDPVGSRINIGEWITVVGVVADAKRQSLDAPVQPTVYLPHTQFTLPFMGLVTRTEGSPGAVASAVRTAVLELDPDLPIGDVHTIEQIIHASTGQPRFRTWLILAFAGLAVLLAVVGVYGLVSFNVAQRTSEMGVRLALGARPWQVCALVMRQGLWLTGAGVVVGLAIAGAATRAIAGLLFETSPADPVVYAGLAGLLLAVAALACYVPARRAMRVDPIAALRAE
jgi:putative ABC transport system permease protein